ncbi:transposase [Micromonospora purpureochromogenes]|uniref:transposase n=1 Tax=Micromonospora purpureochromogenes TaxID=47872 RepID=UPI0033DDB2C2
MPFLDYDHEVRKVLYTTNIIESLNARFRQAARRRGHFPTEQAAMKVLYLVVQQKRKGGGSITGRVYPPGAVSAARPADLHPVA